MHVSILCKNQQSCVCACARARACKQHVASSSSWTVVGQRFDEGFQSAAEQFTVQAVSWDAHWVLHDVLHIQLRHKAERDGQKAPFFISRTKNLDQGTKKKQSWLGLFINSLKSSIQHKRKDKACVSRCCRCAGACLEHSTRTGQCLVQTSVRSESRNSEDDICWSERKGSRLSWGMSC